MLLNKVVCFILNLNLYLFFSKSIQIAFYHTFHNKPYDHFFSPNSKTTIKKLDAKYKSFLSKSAATLRLSAYESIKMKSAKAAFFYFSKAFDTVIHKIFHYSASYIKQYKRIE